MKQFLVIGDSYALEDEQHSHWFGLWAQAQGHAVTYAGLAGGNHVNIVANMAEHNVLNYDGVVYHFTSLLRGEGIRSPEHTTARDHAVTDLMNRSYQSLTNRSQWLDHCLSPTVGGAVETDGEYRYHAQNVVPYFYNPVDGIDVVDVDLPTVQMANSFYRSVSLRWLIRANWLAFENAMLRLSAVGMPTLVALPPCGGFDFVEARTVLPSVKIWNMSTTKHLDPLPHSNHIDRENAQFFAEEFEKIRPLRAIFP